MRTDGWLVLRSAGSVAGRTDLFDAFAREEHVCRKVPKSNAQFVLPLISRSGEGPGRPADRATPGGATAPGDRVGRLDCQMLERYEPAHVVVDGGGRAVHLSARCAPFAGFEVDLPSRRLPDLAPSQLRPALRPISGTPAERRRRIVRRGVETTTETDEVLVFDLVADPLGAGETQIVFREVGRHPSDEDDLDVDVDDFRPDERIRELDDARTTLRTTVEELETSNEDLRSSNEEMMSMNEEFARANADMVDLLERTRIATVFVDGEMRVRGFTPSPGVCSASSIAIATAAGRCSTCERPCPSTRFGSPCATRRRPCPRSSARRTEPPPTTTRWRPRS